MAFAIRPTERNHRTFGYFCLTDKQYALQWIWLRTGTDEDQALVAQCVGCGDLRDGEEILDFRIPNSKRHRELASGDGTPDLGDTLHFVDVDTNKTFAIATVATCLIAREVGSLSVGRVVVSGWRRIR